MKKEDYDKLAADWVTAWNQHDLESIMCHYADELEFYSPVIQQLQVNEQGLIKTKADLRSYFEKGLQKYPDLKFELMHVLAGVDSVVLFYKSINDSVSAEFMELNEEGKIMRVKAHYDSDKR